jgi:DnaD/phage-associated family protein
MTTGSENKQAASPFPRGVQFTPVPNPLLAGILEEITDIGELKITLRVIWALNRKKSQLPYVTARELSADRSVGAMLGVTGDELERAVDRSLKLAVQHGTLLEIPASESGREGRNGESRYLLNTELVRSSLVRKGVDLPEPFTWDSEPRAGPGAETQQAEARSELHHGVYKVYEENIGVMSPLIAESITSALQEHPESDVIDAIRVAVEANARSWKYVTAVLRRWATEGRDGKDRRETDGKPERHSEANRSDEFIEKYLERQRARGNR